MCGIIGVASRHPAINRQWLDVGCAEMAHCPKEPKAAVRYRRYREKQYGKFGAASNVRLVDVGN